MKNFVAKWNSISLILRIAIGLLIGAVLGMACPSLGLIPIFGNVFVGALKGIAPVLVFVLIISALANAKNVPGKQFRTVIGLYMLTTLLVTWNSQRLQNSCSGRRLVRKWTSSGINNSLDHKLTYDNQKPTSSNPKMMCTQFSGHTE